MHLSNRFASLLATSFLIALAAPAAAFATQDIYFEGNPVIGAKIQNPRHHYLTDNHVRQDGCQVAAGARDLSGTLYGSYSYGNGYAAHVYAGTHDLYAVAYFPGCSYSASAAAYY
jgi:hypothetical protein